MVDPPGKALSTEVIETKPEKLELNEEGISTIQHNIQMAEKLVMDVLEMDVDYGIHPGTDSMALRDPGASKINNAFNCFPEHRILYSREDDDLITFHIQANLISRRTGNVVAVGVGQCSTMESKYAFRYVDNPEEYGYDPNQVPRGRGRHKGKYKIPNPEIPDLGNTIMKMAAKRAEVDACQNLPGVGSALVKVFKGPRRPQRQEPDWRSFWGKMSKIGASEEDVHTILKVGSIREWINQGKTLEEAVEVITEAFAQKGKSAQAKPATPAPKPDQKKRSAAEIKESDLPDGYALEKIAFEVWGMQPKQLWDELNYTSVKNFDEAGVEKPWDCFLKLKAVRESDEGALFDK